MTDSTPTVKSNNNPQVYKRHVFKLSHKARVLLIIILVFILLIVAGIIISQRFSYLYRRPIEGALHPKSNILYPPHPAADGRDIYYVLNDVGSPLVQFSGVGINYYAVGTQFKGPGNKAVFTTSSNTKMTYYIVGTFVKWEPVQFSKDKLMVLEDKLDTIDHSTGKPFAYPLIRVGFGIAGPQETELDYETGLGVENLDSVIPATLDPTGGVKTYNLGPLAYINPNDLAKLIKPGDTISVTLMHDTSKGTDTVDMNGNVIAGWIYIRRYSPQQTLKQELGKTLPMQ